jgi:hypothetical protein
MASRRERTSSRCARSARRVARDSACTRSAWRSVAAVASIVCCRSLTTAGFIYSTTSTSPAAAGSGRYFVLPGPSAWPLARHDLAAQEQLTAPDSPRLPALQRTSEARHPRWAAPAQVLSALHVLWRLGEEQVRVVRARQHAATWYPSDRHRETGVLAGRRPSHAWPGRPDRLSSGPLERSACHVRRDCPCDRRYLHGFRLEPRLVIQNDGGAGPMHRCHPLSSTRLRSLTRLTKRWPRMTKAADPISGPRPLRGSGRSF